jgi:predicted metallo-beta-lactamase superfamily hydrolase
MLKKIKVVPLAAESFGVRSMCTYVETADVKILLDAGVSLAPSRFGLPPHPKEYEALIECRRKIAEAAEKADVVTLSHYHFDHHTPSYTDWLCNWSSAEVARQIYEGKIVLAKSYKDKVNFSQRRRGWMFSKTGGKYAKKVESADGKTFEFVDTKLKFSEPVFHGPTNSLLGWLIMTTIEYESERILFASDVQGPMHNPTLDIILAQKPQLIIIGGPPTYLAWTKIDEEHLEQGMKNLETIVKYVPVTVLEHHLLRDEKWAEHSKPIFDEATKARHRVVTAAEHAQRDNNFLEFRRKYLFETEPPDAQFEKWMKLPLSERKLVKPPI